MTGKGPNQPGYQAPYRPDDHRDVGSGMDFGADLYELYRAGRIDFPDTATSFSHWASAAHDFTPRVTFLNVSVGWENTLRLVQEMRSDLHFALRHTAITMDLVGQALVNIAADFAGTDRAAHDEFNRLLSRNRDLLSERTPDVPKPPSMGDPYEKDFDWPSLEAPGPESWWLPREFGEGVDHLADEVGGLVEGFGDYLGETFDGVGGGAR